MERDYALGSTTLTDLSIKRKPYTYTCAWVDHCFQDKDAMLCKKQQPYRSSGQFNCC